MTDQPTTARNAAIRAVERHPSTTFMAPCESLADAVLTAAAPLLRSEALREGGDRIAELLHDTPEYGLWIRDKLYALAAPADDDDVAAPRAEALRQEITNAISAEYDRLAQVTKLDDPAASITTEDAVAFVEADDTPTGQRYPCGLSVYCDTCRTEFRSDFLVTDSLAGPGRLELIRNHARTKLGWQCDAAGDYCPTCRTTPPANPSSELRQAADDLEALHTAATGTSWLIAREQDTHPEGDGAHYVIGIEPTDGDPDSIVFQDPEISEEDAAYIAAIGPDIATHLVQLMRHEAAWFELPEAANDPKANDNDLLSIAHKINNRPR